MQRGHITSKVAVEATSCVCMKFHSGKLTSMEVSLTLDPSMACSIWCGIQVHLVATYFLNATVEIHCLTNRLRVQCATWEVVQQFLWFQQEHSVRTAGSWSTLDIWPQILAIKLLENAAATFAWTRHQKLQLVEQEQLKRSCTLLKSTVEHCLVPCTSVEEN